MSENSALTLARAATRTEPRQCSSAPRRPSSTPSLPSLASLCVSPDATPPPHSLPVYRRSLAPPQNATPTSALHRPEPAPTQSSPPQAQSLPHSPPKPFSSYTPTP